MKLLDLEQYLAQHTYPGRGIALGRTPDSNKVAVAYFIMGRSENSRNRIFEETEDGIRTRAFDESKMTDPSLIIYHPVRILENGMTFAGRSIGSGEERICEMVFNTSMTGYQEILTDPSYAGQGIVMSYPLIGNYGVNHEDNESGRPWAEAFVVRHLSPRGSNFRCEGTLDDYLKKHDITGIEGIDTRALTKILRSQGSMNGMVTCAEHFNVAEALEKIRAFRVEGTVERVSRKQPEDCPAYGEEKYRVAMMDFGVKQNMIERLATQACRLHKNAKVLHHLVLSAKVFKTQRAKCILKIPFF